MLRIGYHVSVAKSIDLAFDRAAEMGCTAMQIFVSNPRGWEVKDIPEEDVGNFIGKSKTFDVDPVVAHMPYLPNLGSTGEATHKKTTETLDKTIRLCSELGIKYLVTHLGSHLGKGTETGIRNVIAAINQADGLGRVKLLLENTSGSTNSIGSTVEELAAIYDGVSGKVGFCLDTCHLFAAGYDIRKAETMDEIYGKVGMKNVNLFHLNDTKFDLGSHLDRHENIGKGFIGAEGIRKFLSHKGVKEKPMILETPENFPKELDLVRKLAGN
ncbi:MAG TPA: deoxyribonuclease IV [Candidatus Saccharimonadales bacterium]|nr:deoxyribonuclease IV [Candidatus Saccharimonadales bacterium]